MGNAALTSQDAAGGRGATVAAGASTLSRPGSVTPERQGMCHHLVALAQVGHAGADGYDRPGRLRPERHRSRPTDPPAADPDKLVPIADTGGDDVDQSLVSGKRRRLVHVED